MHHEGRSGAPLRIRVKLLARHRVEPLRRLPVALLELRPEPPRPQANGISGEANEATIFLNPKLELRFELEDAQVNRRAELCTMRRKSASSGAGTTHRNSGGFGQERHPNRDLTDRGPPRPLRRAQSTLEHRLAECQARLQVCPARPLDVRAVDELSPARREEQVARAHEHHDKKNIESLPHQRSQKLKSDRPQYNCRLAACPAFDQHHYRFNSLADRK